MALRLVALALLIGWIVRSEYKKNFEYTPDNDPSSFYTQGSRKAHTLVCVGDSLTCGNASYNYVKDLSGALAPRDFDVVNAGINGSLAKTALDRVDSVLRCKPTHVSILLGSNDLPCALNPIKQREYVKSGRIPAGYNVSIESYLTNLRSIVRKVKSVDGVQVFLCSPPVIGEDLQHEANRAIAGLLDELKEIAAVEGATYLPVHEKMTELLNEHSAKPTKFQLGQNYGNRPATEAYLQHRFLGKSWDEISDKLGLQLTVDGIHLNSTGANVVSAFIESAIVDSVSMNRQR